MTITPAMLALRESGVDLRDGDAYYVAWCHVRAHDDPPVLAAVRNDAAGEVAKIAGCGPEQVTVVEFSPDTLVDVVRRHQRFEDPGFPSIADYLERMWAIVAYRSATIATREHTFTRGEQLGVVDEWREAAVLELRDAVTAAGLDYRTATVYAHVSDPDPDGARTFTIEARRLPPPKES